MKLKALSPKQELILKEIENAKVQGGNPNCSYLSRVFNVSPSTMRAYLKIMQEKGYISMHKPTKSFSSMTSGRSIYVLIPIGAMKNIKTEGVELVGGLMKTREDLSFSQKAK